MNVCLSTSVGLIGTGVFQCICSAPPFSKREVNTYFSINGWIVTSDENKI